MSGKNLRMRHPIYHPMICYFKGLKTVPQPVPKSMGHDLSNVMVFGTVNFNRLEVVVL
jgi:hypothetical protein